MKKLIYILLPFFILCSCGGGNVTSDTESKEIKYDYSNAANVFILSGQSNMEGQSLVSNLSGYYADNGIDPDFYQNGFETIKLSYMGKENSTNKVSPISGEFVKTSLGYGASKLRFGPDVSIAEKLEANRKEGDPPIYLIKFTYSGAGFYGEKTFKAPSCGATGELWKEMVQFIHNCLELIANDGYLPVIKGLLWAQGEADGWSETGARNYEHNMTCFLNDFRDEFGDYGYKFEGKNIAFIDAYISKDSIWAYCDSINATKDKISQMADNHYLINTLSDGLDLKLRDEEHGGGDNCHYTVDSTIRFGWEFAKIIIEKGMLDF